MNPIIRRLIRPAKAGESSSAEVQSAARRRLLRAGVGVLPTVYTLSSGAQTALTSAYACITRSQPDDVAASFVVKTRDSSDHYLRWDAIEVSDGNSSAYCVPTVQYGQVTPATGESCFVQNTVTDTLEVAVPTGNSADKGRSRPRTETQTVTKTLYSPNTNATWINANGTRATTVPSVQLDSPKQPDRLSYVTVDERGAYRNSVLEGDTRFAITGSCWMSIPNQA